LTPSAVERASEAILNLDKDDLESLVEASLATMTPLQVAEDIISPALELIGGMWEEGSANLAQVYLGSRLCEDLLNRILPGESHWRRDSPVIAITNFEDHHSLGKRIVFMTLRSNGYDIIDLGWTDASSIGRAAKEKEVEVLMVSTLMLRSALKSKEIPALLRKNGLNALMVVGGAPFFFDPELAREVGADAVGSNGTDAGDIVRSLMEAMR
jgi:methylmalonyl-CoA mutase cobalamin-binding domain/chain